MITPAQRAVVAALDLPFDLSDDDIMRQFNADGSDIPAEQRKVAPKVPARPTPYHHYRYRR